YLNMAISNSSGRVLQEYIPNLKVQWLNELIVPACGQMGGGVRGNTCSGIEWEYAVVGIGLDRSQLYVFSPTATSIRLIIGSNLDLDEMLRLRVTQLEQGYIQLKKGKWNAIQDEYLRYLYRMGSWGHYLASGEQFQGKIVGITAEGKLE